MTDITSAVAAVEGGRAVSASSTRDVIVASGSEVTQYLQGQISQNAESLAVGATSWSFVLQPQGKVDAWFRITRVGPDSYLIDLESGFGQEAIDRLGRFKLRTDVDFALMSVKMTSLRGPGSGDLAGQLALEVDGIAVPADWTDDSPWDVLHVTADGQPTSEEGGESLQSVHHADQDFLQWDRINRAVPAMGSELDESTIPAAAAVVDVSADFGKGCYVGQELVARVDSRGSNTPTKLVSLSAASSAMVEAGAALTIEGDEVGVVTSIASSGQRLAGLGYVKRAAFGDSDGSLAAQVAAADGTVVDVDLNLVVHPA